MLPFISISVSCFYVLVCFIGAVLCCSTPCIARPLRPCWHWMTWVLCTFLLNWHLPVFQPTVTALLVLLPVYWSVLFYRATAVRAFGLDCLYFCSCAGLFLLYWFDFFMHCFPSTALAPIHQLNDRGTVQSTVYWLVKPFPSY